jgi:hypothetical protein
MTALAKRRYKYFGRCERSPIRVASGYDFGLSARFNRRSPVVLAPVEAGSYSSIEKDFRLGVSMEKQVVNGSPPNHNFLSRA